MFVMPVTSATLPFRLGVLVRDELRRRQEPTLPLT
jgi:hypothetical protein